MLISLIIPCMNRTKELREALPTIFASAQESPPCEIVILDYSSTDGLDAYINEVCDWPIRPENRWAFPAIKGKQYYNSPHARNAAVKISVGEYFMMLSTETIMTKHCVREIRKRLSDNRPDWMCEGWLGRFIVCEKTEFIVAGGYDERFDVYAPEDKDICMRLHRRGGTFETFPADLLTETVTPNEEKLRWLDKRPYTGPRWIKRQMADAMQKIYDENNAKGVLVANEGIEWGAM